MLSELHAVHRGLGGPGGLCPPSAVLAGPGWSCASQTQSAPSLQSHSKRQTRGFHLPQGAGSA